MNHGNCVHLVKANRLYQQRDINSVQIILDRTSNFRNTTVIVIAIIIADDEWYLYD